MLVESTTGLTAWLNDLHGVLGPVAPTALVIISDVLVEHSVSRCPEGLMGLPSVASSPNGADTQGDGLLIRLQAVDERPYALFLATDRLDKITECDCRQVAMLCRLAWQLANAEGIGDVAVDEELDHAIHALRNGLNTVAMSAAVLRSSAMPEPLAQISGDLEAAAQRSIESLRLVAARLNSVP